jgi:hypothetical protein
MIDNIRLFNYHPLRSGFRWDIRNDHFWVHDEVHMLLKHEYLTLQAAFIRNDINFHAA